MLEEWKEPMMAWYRICSVGQPVFKELHQFQAPVSVDKVNNSKLQMNCTDLIKMTKGIKSNSKTWSSRWHKLISA